MARSLLFCLGWTLTHDFSLWPLYRWNNNMNKPKRTQPQEQNPNSNNNNNNNILAIMDTLLMCSLSNDSNGGGKRLTVHRIGHLIHLIIELLLSWSLLVSIYIWHKYFHILCPFGDIYPHTSSPDAFLTNVLNMIFPGPWASSQSIGYNPWISE